MDRWLRYTVISVGFVALDVWNNYVRAEGEWDIALRLLVASKLSHVILFNAALNIILLYGKIIQLIFFGPLLPSESENSRRRVLKYTVLKIIFVMAVIETEVRSRMMAVWAVWFAVLGLFHAFSGLAKDRFDNILTLTPNARPGVHISMITFLFGILFANLGWFSLCIPFFWKRQQGWSFLLLLIYECLVCFLYIIQTLIKYALHLYDLSQPGTWDPRTSLMYYAEFTTESLALVATLFHYCHILVVNGFGLSLSDAFIAFHVYLYMRKNWHNLVSKILAYQAYRRLDHAIETKFARVSLDDLRHVPDCIICFESLHAPTARKFPCGHVFHTSCMRRWLQTQSTCPLCRSLLVELTKDETDSPIPSQSPRSSPPPINEHETPVVSPPVDVTVSSGFNSVPPSSSSPRSSSTNTTTTSSSSFASGSSSTDAFVQPYPIHTNSLQPSPSPSIPPLSQNSSANPYTPSVLNAPHSPPSPTPFPDSLDPSSPPPPQSLHTPPHPRRPAAHPIRHVRSAPELFNFDLSGWGESWLPAVSLQISDRPPSPHPSFVPPRHPSPIPSPPSPTFPSPPPFGQPPTSSTASRFHAYPQQ